MGCLEGRRTGHGVGWGSCRQPEPLQRTGAPLETLALSKIQISVKTALTRHSLDLAVEGGC